MGAVYRYDACNDDIQIEEILQQLLKGDIGVSVSLHCHIDCPCDLVDTNKKITIGFQDWCSTVADSDS